MTQGGRDGRKTKLMAIDLHANEEALQRRPSALDYETVLRSEPRVDRLIDQLCGVRYHPAHVWRLLGQLGWSCQRPVGRALERDEEAIQHWKKYRWPQLKKKPAGRAKPSSSSTRAD